MSEKTAKKKRKEQQQEGKVVWEMTVRVLARPDGATGIQIKNMPTEFHRAMGLCFDITKSIAQHFVNEAAGGHLFKAEPSRIVPASMIPKFKQ